MQIKWSECFGENVSKRFSLIFLRFEYPTIFIKIFMKKLDDLQLIKNKLKEIYFMQKMEQNISFIANLKMIYIFLHQQIIK